MFKKERNAVKHFSNSVLTHQSNVHLSCRFATGSKLLKLHRGTAVEKEKEKNEREREKSCQLCWGVANKIYAVTAWIKWTWLLSIFLHSSTAFSKSLPFYSLFVDPEQLLTQAHAWHLMARENKNARVGGEIAEISSAYLMTHCLYNELGARRDERDTWVKRRRASYTVSTNR